MPKSARDVMAALEAKGFRKKENDHTFFHLWVEGRKTPVYTKVSHGEREIRDRLLGIMARQLKLSGKQFRELIECPLTAAEYIRLLRSGGHIS
jgi:hypothetical protein